MDKKELCEAIYERRPAKGGLSKEEAISILMQREEKELGDVLYNVICDDNLVQDKQGENILFKK